MSLFDIAGTQTSIAAIYDSECMRFRGRYYGSWRARVVDNTDPLSLGRVRVVVPKVLGLDSNDVLIQSVWAFPKTPLGGKPDVGALMVPDLEAWIYVEFEEGITSKPLYSGGWNPGEDTQSSQVPKVFKTEGDGDDISATDKGDDSLSRALGGTSNEPAAPYDPEYPLNRGMRTQAGHVLEVDDTEGKERIHIWHTSGTFMEMHPDGSMVVRTKNGRRYTLVEKDDDLHVKGDRHESFDGDHTEKQGGSSKIQTGTSHEEEIGTSRSITVGTSETRSVGTSQTETVGANATKIVGGHSTEVVAGIKTITAPLIKLN